MTSPTTSGSYEDMIRRLIGAMPINAGAYSDDLNRAWIAAQQQQGAAALQAATQVQLQNQTNQMRMYELMGLAPSADASHPPSMTDAAQRWRSELQSQSDVQRERLRQENAQMLGYTVDANGNSTGNQTLSGRQQGLAELTASQQNAQRLAELSGYTPTGADTLARSQFLDASKQWQAQQAMQTMLAREQQGWQTGERQGTQAWQSGESAADRAARLALQENSQGWQTGERQGTQAWQSGESLAERNLRLQMQAAEYGQQTSERLGTQSWQSGESAAERAARLQLQESQQTWQSGESAQERQLRLQLQSGELGQQEAEFARTYLLQQQEGRRAQAALAGYTDDGNLTEAARAARAGETTQRAQLAAQLLNAPKDVFRAGAFFRELNGGNQANMGFGGGGISGFNSLGNRLQGTGGTLTPGDVYGAVGGATQPGGQAMSAQLSAPQAEATTPGTPGVPEVPANASGANSPSPTGLSDLWGGEGAGSAAGVTEAAAAPAEATAAAPAVTPPADETVPGAEPAGPVEDNLSAMMASQLGGLGLNNALTRGTSRSSKGRESIMRALAGRGRGQTKKQANQQRREQAQNPAAALVAAQQQAMMGAERQAASPAGGATDLASVLGAAPAAPALPAAPQPRAGNADAIQQMRAQLLGGGGGVAERWQAAQQAMMGGAPRNAAPAGGADQLAQQYQSALGQMGGAPENAERLQALMGGAVPQNAAPTEGADQLAQQYQAAMGQMGAAPQNAERLQALMGAEQLQRSAGGLPPMPTGGVMDYASGALDPLVAARETALRQQLQGAAGTAPALGEERMLATQDIPNADTSRMRDMLTAGDMEGALRMRQQMSQQQDPNLLMSFGGSPGEQERLSAMSLMQQQQLLGGATEGADQLAQQYQAAMGQMGAAPQNAERLQALMGGAAPQNAAPTGGADQLAQQYQAAMGGQATVARPQPGVAAPAAPTGGTDSAVDSAISSVTGAPAAGGGGSDATSLAGLGLESGGAAEAPGATTAAPTMDLSAQTNSNTGAEGAAAGGAGSGMTGGSPTPESPEEASAGIEPGGPVGSDAASLVQAGLGDLGLGMNAGGQFPGRVPTNQQGLASAPEAPIPYVDQSVLQDPEVKAMFDDMRQQGLRQATAVKKGERNARKASKAGPDAEGGLSHMTDKLASGQAASNERYLRGLSRMMQKGTLPGMGPAGPVDAPLFPENGTASMPELQDAGSLGGGGASFAAPAPGGSPTSLDGLGLGTSGIGSVDPYQQSQAMDAMNQKLMGGVGNWGPQELEKMSATQRGLAEGAAGAAGINWDDLEEAYAQTRFANTGNALMA